MKAAESYPIFSVQFSLLVKKLSNVAGSKALSMTSFMVYMILSRFLLMLTSCMLLDFFFFYCVSIENSWKKTK